MVTRETADTWNYRCLSGMLFIKRSYFSECNYIFSESTKNSHGFFAVAVFCVPIFSKYAMCRKYVFPLADKLPHPNNQVIPERIFLCLGHNSGECFPSGLSLTRSRSCSRSCSKYGCSSYSRSCSGTPNSLWSCCSSGSCSGSCSENCSGCCFCSYYCLYS